MIRAQGRKTEVGPTTDMPIVDHMRQVRYQRLTLPQLTTHTGNPTWFSTCYRPNDGISFRWSSMLMSQACRTTLLGVER